MKDQNWKRMDTLMSDPYGIEYKFTLAVGMKKNDKV